MYIYFDICVEKIKRFIQEENNRNVRLRSREELSMFISVMIRMYALLYIYSVPLFLDVCNIFALAYKLATLFIKVFGYRDLFSMLHSGDRPRGSRRILIDTFL